MRLQLPSPPADMYNSRTKKPILDTLKEEIEDDRTDITVDDQLPSDLSDVISMQMPSIPVCVLIQGTNEVENAVYDYDGLRQWITEQQRQGKAPTSPSSRGTIKEIKIHRALFEKLKEWLEQLKNGANPDPPNVEDLQCSTFNKNRGAATGGGDIDISVLFI